MNATLIIIGFGILTMTTGLVLLNLLLAGQTDQIWLFFTPLDWQVWVEIGMWFSVSALCFSYPVLSRKKKSSPLSDTESKQAT